MSEALDARRKRLIFRCNHRGMQETDLLLGGFATKHAGDLDEEQLEQFEALLEEADNDIFNWLSGAEPVPPIHDTDLMKLLFNFKNSLAAR